MVKATASILREIEMGRYIQNVPAVNSDFMEALKPSVDP